MQPRQRSKCVVTVADSATVPSTARVHEVDAPARRVHLLVPARYVGQVGRQKPQWTQSDVSSLGMGEVSGEDSVGSSRFCIASFSRLTLSGMSVGVSCGIATPAAGRTTASDSSARTASELARTQTDASASLALPMPRFLQRRASPPRLPTSAIAVASWASTARADLEQHGDTPGMNNVERARLEPRAEQRRDDRGAVLGLDEQRLRSLRQRVQAEAHAPDERQPSLGAAYETGEVVARDVLHDFAAGVRDRPVCEHESDAEDEVARRAEAMAERPGDVPGQEPADRGIARRIERQTLVRGGEHGLEVGQPQSGFDGARQVTGLVLEDARETIGGEVLADPQLPAFAVGRGQ